MPKSSGSSFDRAPEKQDIIAPKLVISQFANIFYASNGKTQKWH